MATTMPRSAALFDSPDTLALDWKGLYQEHGSRLRRIAERRVGTEHAEDVVQDVFMRAFRNRGSLDPSRPIGAWLSSITLCSSTDVLRRRSVRPEVVEEDEQEPAADGTVEDEFENMVRRVGIEEALESLSERHQRVFRRLVIDGWSQEEVAAAEGISTEAVKSVFARARHSFKKAYEAFAERMGVFGGAAVGTTVVRLRSRIQRWQELVGEHVGAITAAAAAVTVVAIATVPSARPVATDAQELGPAVEESVDEHAESSDGPSVSITEQPTSAVVSYVSPADTSTKAEATQASSSTSVQASAEAGRDGQGASIGITTGTDGPEGDRQTTADVVIEDCDDGFVVGMACDVLETTE